MKLFKKIVIIILVVVAIPFVIALFVKNEYQVQRETTIDKPVPEVFGYIKYLKNQDNYSKWVRLDPAMKKAFKGTDGTVGFVYAWDGNKDAGKGEQEITSITEGQKVDVAVRFIKPFEGEAQSLMTTEAISPTQTKFTWAMNGKNKYPMNFMNLFLGKLLGKDLDSSLGMLKSILEHSRQL